MAPCRSFTKEDNVHYSDVRDVDKDKHDFGITQPTIYHMPPKMRGFHLGASIISLLSILFVFIYECISNWRNFEKDEHSKFKYFIPLYVYLSCQTICFTMSAIYHRYRFSEGEHYYEIVTPKNKTKRIKKHSGTKSILQKFDHSSIYILISGSTQGVIQSLVWTYKLIDPSQENIPKKNMTLINSFIILTWIICITGMAKEFLFKNKNRFLNTIIYIIHGCLPIICLILLIHIYSNTEIASICLGGACYIVGGILYSHRFPKTNNNYFGFHELWHIITILSCVCMSYTVWRRFFIYHS